MQLRQCGRLVPLSTNRSQLWNKAMQSKSNQEIRENEIFKSVVGVMMVALILFGILQLLNVVHV
jgi:hypothetical protein